jgi:hypothetical protein
MKNDLRRAIGEELVAQFRTYVQKSGAESPWVPWRLWGALLESEWKHRHDDNPPPQTYYQPAPRQPIVFE